MPASKVSKVRIVCISDTHNTAPGEGFTLPNGDVLVHAGDLTNQGSYSELKKAIDWIERADFAVKIVVAGNHDLSLDSNYTLKHKEGWTVEPGNVEACRELLTSNTAFTYLQHEATVVELPEKNVSLCVFGSPYSPDRGRQNWAFQYPQDQADDIWKAISSKIDVLVTHTPPKGHCDASEHWREGGCQALTQALGRARPILHICGHCHEGRGADIIDWSGSGAGADSVLRWEDPSVGTKKQSSLDLTGRREGKALEPGKATAVVNGSIMAKSFGHGPKLFNKPIVVDLDIPVRYEKRVS